MQDAENSPDPGITRASTSDSFSFGRTTVAKAQEPQSVYMLPLEAREYQGAKGPRGSTYVCPRASQIDNLGTPIAILFQARALETVEGVRDAFAAAHDTLVLVVAEAALVAYADERRGTDVRVANRAFAVALVAEAADGDAGLLATHYEIGMMAGHDGRVVWCGMEGSFTRGAARKATI